MNRTIPIAISSVIAVIITLAALYVLSPKAHCSWCDTKGKECYSNFDCGLGCECYKARPMTGVCGPR